MIISDLLTQQTVQSATVQTLVFMAEFLYCFVSHMTQGSCLVRCFWILFSPKIWLKSEKLHRKGAAEYKAQLWWCHS